MGQPGLGENLSTANVNADQNAFSVFIEYRKQGQFGPEYVVVAFLLPPVMRNALAEVAKAIEQPYRDQRNIEITGRFEVVSGKDAEAAGVIRKGMMDPEFGTEISDGVAAGQVSEVIWLGRQI